MFRISGDGVRDASDCRGAFAMRSRRSVAVGAMALLLTSAAAGMAGASGAGTVPMASGDPYVNCTIGGAGTGVSAPHTQIEPWLAVDPHNSNHVIGSWQQDRWSSAGGSRGLTAAY